MTATVPGGYFATTNFPGTFNTTSVGYVQGMFIDDPAIRYQLVGGVLATTETLPMWGGVGITESVLPNTGTNPPDATQGGLISRATLISSTGATGALTGFSVFNQAYGMVITTGSPVPLSASNMQVNFFRLGSNARIVVACASGLTALEGGPISAQVSWDFNGQQLIPYIAAYSAVSAGGITAGTYTSSTGIIALTFSTAPFGAGIGTGANGVYITIAGITSSVSANSAAMNGDFAVTGTATSGTVISVQGPVGLGVNTLTVTGATLAAGGGALPVKVIEILVGNSLTVVYNSTANTASWNYTGTVAVIQI